MEPHPQLQFWSRDFLEQMEVRRASCDTMTALVNSYQVGPGPSNTPLSPSWLAPTSGLLLPGQEVLRKQLKLLDFVSFSIKCQPALPSSETQATASTADLAKAVEGLREDFIVCLELLSPCWEAEGFVHTPS